MRCSICFRLALATLAVGAIGCMGRGESQSLPAAVPTTVSVETAAVVTEEIASGIDVTGSLAPWEEAVVSLEVDGRLTKVAVDLGDRVRRGAVLAQIAPEEYQFRKVQTEADLAAAEADFNRIQKLAQKQMAPVQQLDEGRRRLEVARTAAELARKKNSDTTLRAPIDGVIAKRMVNVGEYLRVGTPAFQIVRITPLKLKAEVPERFIADVKLGAAVRVVSEATGARVLQGQIVRISPMLAVDSRSLAIEAKIDNPQGAVRPGIFVRATIQSAGAHRALAVPESAVFTFAGTPRVFVLQGGRAKERVIEIAGRRDGRVLIAKGLTDHERVIASAIERLQDGQPVAVR